MNLNECIIKLCNYYHQPIKDNKNRMPLVVLVASKWVDDNVVDFDDFFDQIVKRFEPTMTTPFPTLAHLEKYYIKPIPEYKPDYKSDLPAIGELTIDEEIPDKIDKQAKDVLGEYIIDEIKLSFKNMLHKYGKAICREIEGAKGRWSLDNNFEIISVDGHERWPDGGWKSEMLLKYIDIK
jgi:hypothetical protein